jgi:hypothetical protein
LLPLFESQRAALKKFLMGLGAVRPNGRRFCSAAGTITLDHVGEQLANSGIGGDDALVLRGEVKVHAPSAHMRVVLRRSEHEGEAGFGGIEEIDLAAARPRPTAEERS